MLRDTPFRTLAKLAWWQGVQQLRAFLPNRILRSFFILVTCLIALGLVTAALFAPVKRNLDVSIIQFFGMINIALVLSLSMSFIRISRFYETHAFENAMLYSPLPRWSLPGLLLMSTLVQASLPLFFFYLPFTLYAIRTAPLVAATLFLFAFGLLIFALALGLALGRILVERFGRVKAAYWLRLIGIIIGCVCMFYFPTLIRISYHTNHFFWILGSLVVTSPLLLVHELTRMTAYLQVPLVAGRSSDPRWGQLQLLTLFWKSQIPLLALGTLTGIVFSVTLLEADQRATVLGPMLLMFAALPATRLAEWVQSHQPIFRLAPHTASILIRLYLVFVLPFALVAIAAAYWFGTSLHWKLTLLFAISLSQGLFLIAKSAYRSLLIALLILIIVMIPLLLS